MDQDTKKELLDLVRQSYQEIAVGFDATRQKAIWPQMEALGASLKPGAKILDVGCGNGRLLKAFVGSVDYLGVDNSEALLASARKNYPGREFRLGDILELDKIPEKDFSDIFCLAVLQHLPGRDLRRKALEQMRDKLAPDGRLVISAWNLWRNQKYRLLLFKNYWFKILGKHRRGFNDLVFPWKDANGKEVSPRYYHVFSVSGLKALARLAGLKIESFKREGYNYWMILVK